MKNEVESPTLVPAEPEGPLAATAAWAAWRARPIAVAAGHVLCVYDDRVVGYGVERVCRAYLERRAFPNGEPAVFDTPGRLEPGPNTARHLTASADPCRCGD